jgi:hypothetical protein
VFTVAQPIDVRWGAVARTVVASSCRTPGDPATTEHVSPDETGR